jgi:hypothetical protein
MHALSRFSMSLVLLVSLGLVSVAGCTSNSNEDESVDRSTAPRPPATPVEEEFEIIGPAPGLPVIPVTTVDCEIVDCRSGFHCVETGPKKGKCVSLCNPECQGNEGCYRRTSSETWDCYSSAPPAEGGSVAPEEPVDDQVETW